MLDKFYFVINLYIYIYIINLYYKFIYLYYKFIYLYYKFIIVFNYCIIIKYIINNKRIVHIHQFCILVIRTPIINRGIQVSNEMNFFFVLNFIK
jgi:hypothetical protein